MMTDGARLNDIVHTVRAPAHLLEKPYLQPVYDDPEFIVHNIWRLYGGWYDGNPSSLKPAREAALAAELATLAGGPGRLAARARELATNDDGLRLAGHLVELAALAAPDDRAVQAARAAVGTPPGRGTRAVASYDEDTTTMGVEAARVALAAAPEGVEVGQLLFASSNPAYLDKTNATAIHAALGLDPSVGAYDMGGSVRS